VLPVLCEERLQHPEALGDPVAVPGIDTLLVELVGAADVFQRAQVVERVDLAGDDLRKSAHIRPVEGIGGQQLRPGMHLVEIFEDRE